MESLAFAVLTLCLSLIAALLIPVVASLFRGSRSGLPPGPARFPIIGNLHWLRVSINRIEPLLRQLRRLYAAPAVTLHIGSRPVVFISDRDLAHEALVHRGAAFAGRPRLLEASRVLSNNGCTVNSATYGSRWRLLRRNLTSEILHPSRVRLFTKGREWVLDVLLDKLQAQAAEQDGIVSAMVAFQYSMFCLLVLMCFGERPGEAGIRKIEKIQRDMLLFFRKVQVFAFFPGIARYLFPGRWKTLMEMRQRQTDIYFPLIQARRDRRKKAQVVSNDKDSSAGDDSFVYSYVDSLLDLELPEENGRKLTDYEIMGLCSEFLNAGTDTTSTALQWIMANLVKNPEVQAKLFDEIRNSTASGSGVGRVSEEDLPSMPYLKAVVLEGLRRHPPGHFVLPHSTTQEVSVGGYVFPKGVSVNFTVAEMGWDQGVWKEPMEFRPERFLPGGEGEGVDITGSREIKMMPFGVGRRICPGLNLAMLHLEYFIANLVAAFEWRAVDGEEVDLEEKPEFTIVMKNPLRARLVHRSSSPLND